ncbi:MAG: cytochrome c oxidase subunit II [Chloroflexi bacterium]|nr:cytochrome c oxidase subunit II [Chloroflexota bacterium]
MKRPQLMGTLLLLVSFIGILFLLTGGRFSPARQLSGEDASTLNVTGDKTVQFVLVVLGVLGAMGGIAAAIAFVAWRLNRDITQAQSSPAEPTNPLDYRIYGHRAALVLIGGITILMLVFCQAVSMIPGFGGQDILPVAAGEEAQSMDHLFLVEYLVMAVIFGLVAGLFLHSLLYFHAAKDDRSDGEFIHGNNKLELGWTIIPAIIVTLLGIYALITFIGIFKEEDNEYVIKVTAQQWAWRFEYPDNPDTEANDGFISSELVLLQNQPIRLEMNSLDVIHSFWVPELRIKQDVTPGVETLYRVTPTLPGDYSVRCTEICGLNHSLMLAPVRILDQSSYNKWVEGKLAELQDPVAVGETLTTPCRTCHSVDGSRIVGPTWKELYGSEVPIEGQGSVLADENYILNSILNPNGQIHQGYPAGIMPQTYGSTFSEVQLRQILAYIKSLSATGQQELQSESPATEQAPTGDLQMGAVVN